MSDYKIHYKKLPTQAKVFDDINTKTIMQSMGLGGGKTYNPLHESVTVITA
jgi:hypothetical protein